MPTRVTEFTQSNNLPARYDSRLAEVDLEELPPDQEAVAPSFVPLVLEQWSIRRETFPVVCSSHQILFLNQLFASPMHRPMSLL